MAIEERMEEGKKWRSIKVRQAMTNNFINEIKKNNNKINEKEKKNKQNQEREESEDTRKGGIRRPAAVTFEKVDKKEKKKLV